MAERLPGAITQIHSNQYRNPAQLPEGEVLVVGSGQSGAQIAEDLHLAGRKVHLAVGDAPVAPGSTGVAMLLLGSPTWAITR